MVTAFLEPALDEKDDDGCSTASTSTELVIEDDGRRREIASHTEVEKLSNVVELTPLHQSLWFTPKSRFQTYIRRRLGSHRNPDKIEINILARRSRVIHNFSQRGYVLLISNLPHRHYLSVCCLSVEKYSALELFDLSDHIALETLLKHLET